jgi:hypothetical protein
VRGTARACDAHLPSLSKMGSDLCHLVHRHLLHVQLTLWSSSLTVITNVEHADSTAPAATPGRKLAEGVERTPDIGKGGWHVHLSPCRFPAISARMFRLGTPAAHSGHAECLPETTPQRIQLTDNPAKTASCYEPPQNKITNRDALHTLRFL